MTKGKLDLERSIDLLVFVDRINVAENVIVVSEAVEIVLFIGTIIDFVIIGVSVLVFIEQLLELIFINWKIAPDCVIVSIILVIRLIRLKEPREFIVRRLWLERLGFWFEFGVKFLILRCMMAINNIGMLMFPFIWIFTKLFCLIISLKSVQALFNA